MLVTFCPFSQGIRWISPPPLTPPTTWSDVMCCKCTSEGWAVEWYSYSESGGRECKNKFHNHCVWLRAPDKPLPSTYMNPTCNKALRLVLERMLVCVHVCPCVCVCVCMSLTWLHNKSRGKWFIQNFCIILNWHNRFYENDSGSTS